MIHFNTYTLFWDKSLSARSPVPPLERRTLISQQVAYDTTEAPLHSSAPKHMNSLSGRVEHGRKICTSANCILLPFYSWTSMQRTELSAKTHPYQPVAHILEIAVLSLVMACEGGHLDSITKHLEKKWSLNILALLLSKHLVIYFKKTFHTCFLFPPARLSPAMI